MCEKLDLTGVRIYSDTKEDVKDAMNLIGEEVYLSDFTDFADFVDSEPYVKTKLAKVKYADGITYPYVAGDKYAEPYKYLIRAEDAKFKEEKKTNVNIEEDMNFIKTWKSCVQSCSIHYLPELPSEDIKVEECTMVAVPGEKSDQINLYTRSGGKWILTTTIDRSISVLKELKEAHDDLENAIRKLNKITSNIENDALSSKLSRITSKVLQAKYELAEDILEPFENRDTEMWKGLTNEYLKNC